MNKPLQTPDPNARPCFLHGCQTDVHADGSTVCRVCGIWRGPDLAMVNALLRANAGGVEYRKQAAALKMIPPIAPKPIPPPLVKNVDGAHTIPDLSLRLLTIGAFLTGAAAAVAWMLRSQLGDWMSK